MHKNAHHLITLVAAAILAGCAAQGTAPVRDGSGAAAAPAAEAGPALHLHFTSPAHAEAWIERDLSADGPAIELQPLELARSAFTNERPGSAWQQCGAPAW